MGDQKSRGDVGPALRLARAWVDALNRRSAKALSAILAEDFTYWGMARTPPDLGVRWGRDAFITAVQRGGGGMRKPVLMTIVRDWEAGDRAVVEAEGHGERRDGGVYANDYCLIFEVRDGQVTAVRDYCCTATALGHFRALAEQG